MLDKTIDSALVNLRKQIIRGSLDGLPHVEALLILRGLDPASQHVTKPRPDNLLARRAMGALILDCLRDGQKRGRDVAAYVAAHEPSVTYTQAMRRVYQGLHRLHKHGMVTREGRLWGVA
jgi:hypothetical protein